MKAFAALLAFAPLAGACAQMMEGDTVVYPKDAAYPAGLAAPWCA